MLPKRNLIKIAGETVRLGQTRDIQLKISETYLGLSITVPVRVMRAKTRGPTIFLTAAIHGDEVNGTGIIHELISDPELCLKKGTLILVPVVNVFGFESHERYLPDRRDLNRSFPGSPTGTIASRVAYVLMNEIVRKCDYGIDFHTAAIQRTNFPNVRGDLKNAKVKKLAERFGCELIVDSKGPEGSLRREACLAGCPTIILEAGEPWKVEPSVQTIGVRGIKNVLIDLGMIQGALRLPLYQARVTKTKWVRSEVGGILKFHIAPGNLVAKGQPIATNFSILGEHQEQLLSPFEGIVLSMTTMPMVKPGEPVCHIAKPSMKAAAIHEALDSTERVTVHQQVRVDLASNISVSESQVPST